MSAHLLLAALACDEDISSDCEAATRNGKDEEPAAEAISHTSKAGWHGATDLDISTRRKYTRKQKTLVGAVGGTAAKRGKPEPMFQAATGAD